jgi:hypothetical protein
MVSNLLLVSAMAGFVLLIRWYIKVDVLKQFSMHEGLFAIRRAQGVKAGDDGEDEAKAQTDGDRRLRGRRGSAGTTPGGRQRPR